jgi:hypothetical protein
MVEAGGIHTKTFSAFMHKKETNMKIEIPSERIYQVPQGDYRAVLTAVQHLTSRGKVRFFFEIISKHPKRGRYAAGKNYDISLAKGSQLREDLARWRGHDLTEQELEAGSVDFERFVGREADIVIRHIPNGSHKDPFCHIAEILPPGSLVKIPAQLILQPAFCEI